MYGESLNQTGFIRRKGRLVFEPFNFRKLNGQFAIGHSGNRTHGYGSVRNRTLTYNSWRAMLDRCENKNASNYFKYGAKRITICEAWHKFENFLKDMGERQKGFTLDRINSRGNYEPNNCRWATPKQQAANRRIAVPNPYVVRNPHTGRLQNPFN